MYLFGIKEYPEVKREKTRALSWKRHSQFINFTEYFEGTLQSSDKKQNSCRP